MPRKASAGSAELIPSVKLLNLLRRLKGRAAGAAAGLAAPGSQVGPIKPQPRDKAAPSHRSHVSPGAGGGPHCLSPLQCPPENGAGRKSREEGSMEGQTETGEQRGPAGAGQILLTG